MKVAIVHDYIKEYGGAERVLEALHEIYPDAPVFTSVYMPSFLGPHRERFVGWDIRTSFLQYIPFKHKLISPFRMFSPWVFKQFSARGGPAFGWDLSDYDVVIVSATGAYFPNMVKTKSPLPPLIKGVSRRTGDFSGAVQICYCHTPPRYLYGYATARDWKKNRVFAVLGAVVNHFLRMVDFAASRNVDYYIANSEEVAGRIEKFYRRKPTVIYPPVEIQHINSKNQESRIKNQGREDYFLTGGRLAMAKHFDLIVQACRELDAPLKVFGKVFAGYGEKLENLSGPKTEFLGEVSDDEKFKLMAKAKAFLFASEDEDFGIVPVEAMGAGVPVIAFKSGGVKETIIDGKTGVFFEELTSESLKKAIMRFEKLQIDAKDCRMQAEKFSKERFVKNIKQFVDKKFAMI